MCCAPLLETVTEKSAIAGLVMRRRSFVFPNHSSISVVCAHRVVLTTNERETGRATVVCGRRGDRAANAAAKSMLIHEAIPIHAARFEIHGEYATGPICVGRKV